MLSINLLLFPTLFIFAPRMEVFKKILPLKESLNRHRTEGRSIGLVPTMGALHAGHLSLVDHSMKQNDITVTSIFINPAQFNNPEDLNKYPRMVDNDLILLSTAHCDIVFLPDESEIYPEKDTRIFDLNGLDQVMEGSFRPGHFNGVAQVVTRLFDIVKPHRAYFGLKDFQQFTIIKHIVKTNNVPVEIVGCPIVREPNGLALSSRNLRLSDEERQIASNISKALFYVRDNYDKFTDYWELKEFVINFLKKIQEIKIEYFEIVNELTLKEITGLSKSDSQIACIAAWVGNVRLIDNVKFYS